MIQVALYKKDYTTLEKVFAPSEMAGLQFSTRLPGGFYRCQFSLPMSLSRSWAWLDREFYHLVITEARKAGTYQTLWEGRLEDPEITPSGVTLTAYGYYANLGDIPYKTAYNDVWTTVFDTVLTANCSQISATRHITASDRVATSAAGSSWLDITAMDMVPMFLDLSDSTDAMWDCAVWEDREVWVTKRSPTALNWLIDMADLKRFGLRKVGKELYNSCYARYQAGGALTRTADADDATSQSRYLKRQYAIPDKGTIAAQEAVTARDAYLAKNKDLWPSFSSSPVIGSRVRDVNGVSQPSNHVRAGQVIRIVDLVPASATLDSVTLDTYRTFFIVETNYDVDRGELSLVFDRDQKTLTALLARS